MHIRINLTIVFVCLYSQTTVTAHYEAFYHLLLQVNKCYIKHALTLYTPRETDIFHGSV